MSEHDKDLAFLRQCILHCDSAERHKLEESIAHLQRNERAVRRAVGLMALLLALGIAGLCYCAIWLTDFPQNMTQFMMQLTSKIFCSLSLGSLICLLSFSVLALIYRTELNQRRDECRRLAGKMFEARQGILKQRPDPCVPSPNLGE